MGALTTDTFVVVFIVFMPSGQLAEELEAVAVDVGEEFPEPRV